MVAPLDPRESPLPFALRSRRVLTPSGLVPAEVVVRDGRVAVVHPLQNVDATVLSSELPVEDLGDLVLMPGLVDTHVHINEPGRTEWEGFVSAGRAAALGGVTTLCDMPLNSSPVTTTVDALWEKLVAADGKSAVDCAFWGGVVPDNVGSVGDLVDAGVAGFKCFLIDSGLDEFPPVGEAELRVAMRTLARAGLPLLVHAELDLGPGPDALPKDPRAHDRWLLSRPKAWEDAAIELMIRLVRETGCPVHIVHLSSSTALPMLRAAKNEGLPITVETCPHYLCLTAEEIPLGATEFKCAPPIREAANREALWAGLLDGTIDFVITDHSPCIPELKRLQSGDFTEAWGGIASLQLGLRSVWTEASRRGLPLARLSRWMSGAPAELLGLSRRKGRVAAGFDADLVAFEPDEESAVRAEELRHRHPVSPWVGRVLRGRVRHTWLGGHRVVRDAALEEGPAWGRVLLNPTRGVPW